MVTVINIADLQDPYDSEGRSYRQVNADTKHKIPLGSLVELESGARLFVVSHTRDCDQTPLYSLCPAQDDMEQEREGFGNQGWINGYGEESLTVVKAHQ